MSLTNLNLCIIFFVVSFSLINCLNLHTIQEKPKSICPRYWVDATHLNLGCLLFNATSAMSWIEAQNFCGSTNSSTGKIAHLVEIFTAEQQDFLGNIHLVKLVFCGQSLYVLKLL